MLKEVDWLVSDGWLVDTLGLGESSPVNGEHIAIKLPGPLQRYGSYFLRNKRLRFSLLYGKHLPANFEATLAGYDLLVIHDPTFSPWTDLRNVAKLNGGKGIHFDLHENHVDSLSRNLVEKIAFESYRRWEVSQLKSLISHLAPMSTITSVSPWISEIYESHLGARVSTIRNAPKRLLAEPSELEIENIQLVHHGVGTTHRGIEQSIIAMRHLPPKYTLNFHLVSGPVYMAKIRILSLLLGVKKRVTFHSPVPTAEISKTINKYDIALIVIPPITENERHAFPNKFFESLQAGLAIVTGPNPLMSDIVRRSNLGVVLNGWKSKDIVAGLLGTSVKAFRACKTNTKAVSKEFSSAVDRDVFLRCVSIHFH
jgi:glycosyltransferase involved in cell wall biosynthesis